MILTPKQEREIIDYILDTGETSQYQIASRFDIPPTEALRLIIIADEIKEEDSDLFEE